MTNPQETGPQGGDLLSAAAHSVPSAPAEPSSPQDFEAALAELERLVGQLEGGAMPLEDSLLTYRRGVELVRICQQRLARAEQQVKVLEADLLRPLEADDVRGDA